MPAGAAACHLHPRPLFFSSERVLSIEVLKNMAILPVVAFAVLATVVLYASIRGYRRFFPSASPLPSSKSASSLPEPVVGKSSGWSWAKLNLKSRWPRRLSLSGIPRVRVRVPWSRSSSMESGVAPKTKNSKSLGIELLPTTGLPPPPSSLPTPTPTPAPAPPASHVLVDVSVSPPRAAPPPRTPSPPFPVPVPGSYFSSAKSLLLPLHAAAAARPASPHALFTTTPPPKNHKRSRSLGGVPVRRLSSGAGSALRHAVEMDDLGVRNGHTRDTSREHLLIDFSSSSSAGSPRRSGRSEPEVEVEDDPDISPAASDIGVLPLTAPLRTRSESTYGYAHEASFVLPLPPPLPGNAPIAVLPKQVARHVPLVDLEEEEDDSWKWFSDATAAAAQVVVAPVVIMPAHPARASSKPQIDGDAIEMTPMRPKTGGIEKLVDLDEPAAAKTHTPEPVSEMEMEMPLIDIEERNYDEGILVDVTDEKPVQAILQADPVVPTGGNNTAALPQVEAEVMTLQKDVSREVLVLEEEDPFADPPLQHAVLVDDTSPASLADSDPFADPPLVPAAHEQSSTAECVVNYADETRSIEVIEGLQETWSWEDSHDPWHDHTADIEDQTIDAVQQTEDTVAQQVVPPQDAAALEDTSPVAQETAEAEPELLLELSPAGVLNPTVVASSSAEEEAHIPPLDLYIEENKKSVDEHKDGEADEDTPKATPASLTHELPPWGLLESLPVDDDDYYGVGVAREAEDVAASPAPGSPVEPSTTLDAPEYDDPELLDLPLIPIPEDAAHGEAAACSSPAAEDDDLLSLLLTHPGGGSALFSIEKPRAGDGRHTPTPTHLAQTPTPPASPPPPPSHGLALSLSLGTSTRALKSGSSHNSRAVSPVALSAPLLVLSNVTDEQAELSAAGAELKAKAKAKATKAREEEEDKENIAPPVALRSSNSQDSTARPAWSVRAQDAPALGVPSAGYVLGSSPRAMRRALSAESQTEDIAVAVEVLSGVSKETRDTERAVDQAVSGRDDVPATNDASASVLAAPPKDTEPVVAPQIVVSESLPGTFPDPATVSTVTLASPSPDPTPSSPRTATSTAVAVPTRRRTLSQAFAYTLPSVRRLARSPLDVALAMQLRPGLGAGADPAWMVRFLMAMYGWLAVVIAGQDF